MDKLMDKKDVVTEFLKEELKKTKADLESDQSRRSNIKELIDKADSDAVTGFLHTELEGAAAAIYLEELKIFLDLLKGFKRWNLRRQKNEKA